MTDQPKDKKKLVTAKYPRKPITNPELSLIYDDDEEDERDIKRVEFVPAPEDGDEESW